MEYANVDPLTTTPQPGENILRKLSEESEEDVRQQLKRVEAERDSLLKLHELWVREKMEETSGPSILN
jgi:hypothetical protein